ncbi:MAG: presqualene diphosphate synthase HpnD [Chloroflexi bacterium]|nr:presqualene diphosphate synthase HpnD [Chloroflexota bacterium]
MEVDAAYDVCEQITRSRAANFYWGIRLLPPPKRRALSAVYAFARQIDDIGDGCLPPPAKATALAEARQRLESTGNGAVDPVMTALRHAADRFPVPLDAFGDLIDGVEMDVRGDTYETFDDLVVYCRRVAGSIGRLSLGVFESRDMARAEPLADELGVALQLTNILRDVREDLAQGRVYLPREDLAAFACELRPPLTATPAFAALIRFQAQRARRQFDMGLQLLPLLDWRSTACAAAMAGIYRQVLKRIEQDPAAVTRGRVSLSTGAKVRVALWSLLRG